MIFNLKTSVISLTIVSMAIGHCSSSVLVENQVPGQHGSGLDQPRPVLNQTVRRLNEDEIRKVFNKLLKLKTDIQLVDNVSTPDLAILIRRALNLRPYYDGLGIESVDIYRLIQVLLSRADCDINAKVGEFDESLLQVAARTGNLDAFATLAEAGASLSCLNGKQLFPVFVNIPLELAEGLLQYLDIDVIGRLLQEIVISNDSYEHLKLVLEYDIDYAILQNALRISKSYGNTKFANLIRSKLPVDD